LKDDLSSLSVTDFHCFEFPATRNLTKRVMAKVFLSGGPTVKSVTREVREEDLDATVAYRRMIHELSLLFGCRDKEEMVLARRNQKAKDFREYVAFLFDDAGVEDVVIDNGSEPVSFERFSGYCAGRLHRIFRIEPLLKRLLESSKTFGELLDSFDDAVSSAVKRDGFSGFKSVIAYRTGLDVAASTESEAKHSFKAFRDGDETIEWFGPRVKALRDFILAHAAEEARRLGVFLQIHTGIGDTDITDRCNPLLLKDFLKGEEASKVPVVLIHGGYPYTIEAAWLANVFPNVYFELSTPLPPYYIPALSKTRLREALEMVPTTRLVYGSDSHDSPEMHWLAAKLTKRALAESMRELVAEGVVDEDDALKAERNILSRNALGLLRRANPR
jgi:hypothetical protein